MKKVTFSHCTVFVKGCCINFASIIIMSFYPEHKGMTFNESIHKIWIHVPESKVVFPYFRSATNHPIFNSTKWQYTVNCNETIFIWKLDLYPEHPIIIYVYIIMFILIFKPVIKPVIISRKHGHSSQFYLLLHF